MAEQVLKSFGFVTGLRTNPVLWMHPFPVWLGDAIWGVSLLTMVAVLLNRYARTWREQDRVEASCFQAAEVQHVLIPERLPEVRGFRVEAAYLPAQIVGGDFFQVLPVDGGGVLLLVGDVAGRGMAAAARGWGQTDDITVVRLEFVGVGSP